MIVVAVVCGYLLLVCVLAVRADRQREKAAEQALEEMHAALDAVYREREKGAPDA